MKMDMIGGGMMDFGFSFSQAAEYFDALAFNGIRQSAVHNNPANIA
jgi:hypothetical protein